MVESIQFGSKRIEFELQFAERKTLGICFSPDLQILVKAPMDSSIEKIKEKVRKKAPWIIKQENYFLSFHPKTPPRKYIGGESHYYMGRQYRLKIIAGDEDSVKIKGGYIEIVTDDKTKAKAILKNWYLSNAEIKFKTIAKPIIEDFKKYQVEPGAIQILEMPTRWGSCTPKGKIILNPELIKAPRGCIEYVIIHELCHLVHHSHSQKFFDLQAKEMPDWEKWKEKLERLLA